MSYHVGVSTKCRSFARALTHGAILSPHGLTFKIMTQLWNNSGPQGKSFFLQQDRQKGEGQPPDSVFIRGGSMWSGKLSQLTRTGTVLRGMAVTA